MNKQRPAAQKRTPNIGLWVLCALAAFIAVGAAYSSYEHGVTFATRYGDDGGTAAIWPLIVDGMLTSGTVVLWMTRHSAKRGGRWAAWLTFGVGIALSLSANITAAPHLSIFTVMVAGCPPVALLLLIELLNHVLTHHHAETTNESGNGSATRIIRETRPRIPAPRLASRSSRTILGPVLSPRPSKRCGRTGRRNEPRGACRPAPNSTVSSPATTMAAAYCASGAAKAASDWSRQSAPAGRIDL
jgi:hypothetical protein